MVLDGEIIPLTLYAVTRKVSRSGEWLYTPFATLHHIRHAVFNVAVFYRFFDVYDYQEGEYEPYSPIVERGIRKYMVYNPYHDYYEASIEGRAKVGELYNEIVSVLREEEINRLKGIRERTEKYTAQELNVLLHHNEEKYIKVKEAPYDCYEIIGAICKNMLFHYNWQNRPDIITREAAENVLKHFKLDPNLYLGNA